MNAEKTMNGPNLSLDFAMLGTPQSRRDLLRATLVEIGIAMQDTRGTDAAAEYLKSQGIDLEVAVRVLSRPLKRRK